MTSSKETGTRRTSFETLEARRERLDRRIELHAGFLTRLDSSVRALSVDERGRIIEDETRNTRRPLRGEEKALGSLLQGLVQERQPALEELIRKLKQELGVIDARSVFGALVFVYNSAQHTPSIVTDNYLVEPGTRGFYGSEQKDCLGVVGVDLNPALRTDGTGRNATLTHELHHHLFALQQLTVGLDPELQLATATHHDAHRSILARAQGRAYRSNWERARADQENLAALGSGPFSSIQRDEGKSTELFDQRAYLDELHSCFLQRKINWFCPNTKLYSSRKKGSHDVVAGSEPETVAASRDLLCVMQAVYGLFLYHDQFTQDSPQGREALFAKSEQARDFYETYPGIYDAFGGIIGSSRTVSQAARLCLKRWKQLMQSPYIQRNVPQILRWLEKDVNFQTRSAEGQTLSEFLM